MATADKPDPVDLTPITFLIPGEAERDDSGTVCEVRVKAPQRDGSVAIQRMVAIPGQHAVQLSVQDGSGKTLQLVLHPESARALLESQQPDAPPVGARDPGSTWSATVPASDEVLVPTQARWQLPAGLADADGATGQRGPFGDLVGNLVFGVFKLIGLDPVGVAANAGAQAVARFIDDQVTEGVYRLSRTRPASLKNAPTTTLDSTPTIQLVLIHGTAVNTTSTFGDWWDHNPDVVNSVFDAYHDQVYALDHDTLGKSPIFNALTLARALPANARLHLLTHSRGGLVAEVLVRACAGITKADLDFFADTEGCDYKEHRDELEELGNLLKKNNIRILRVVRVACPAHGTYLASGRLDAYFSVLAYLLDSTISPLAGAMMEFLQMVASQRMDPTTLPGLEAMIPGRALTRWINSPCTAVAGDLRVLAGDAEPTLLNHWIRALMAYALHPLFLGDNDLVVNTNAMYGGAVRLDGASFVLDRSADTAHFFYFTDVTQTKPHNIHTPLSRSRERGRGRGCFFAGASQVAARPPNRCRIALVGFPLKAGQHTSRRKRRTW